jgi:hypothetical protein
VSHDTDFGEISAVDSFAGPPLRTGTEEQRSLFVETEWLPFLSELKHALTATKTRYVLGFSPEEVLPPQDSWIAWADKARALTTKWYGQPNLSVLYEMLIETSSYDGDSVYRTSEMRQQRSEDGWANSVDGTIRKAAYKIRDERKAQLTLATSQNAGESQIANTVLPNVMTAAESHVLLAGKLIKDVIVRRFASKQRKCLIAVAKCPSCPTSALGLLPPEKLRGVLGVVKDEELKAVGVRPDSSELKALRRDGVIVSSFGQFTKERRVQMQEFLQKALGKEPVEGKLTKLDAFVSFMRQYPGHIYQGNLKRHQELLQSVLLSKHYVVVKRSMMNQFTVLRYFSNKWQRSCPLIKFDDKEGEKEVRAAGTEEFSRFRSNNFPYMYSHGMSLSGGLDEGHDGGKTIAYEMGVALATDGNAEVGNWFVADFEKILKDAVALNPPCGISDMLPGESYHELAQNPRCSSSIGETAHVQVSRGTASEWAIMRLEQKPVHVPALNAIVDIVQIGKNPDAIHVCVESRNIDAPAIVEMLQQLRLSLYRTCGRELDFILLTAPRGDGFIRASLAIVSTITKDPDSGEQLNAATGELLSTYSLPPAVLVDATNGKGNVVVYAAADMEWGLKGSPAVRDIYDFCRRPGARAVVAEFMKNRYAYIDDSPGMCQKIAEPVVPNGGQGPSLVSFFESIGDSSQRCAALSVARSITCSSTMKRKVGKYPQQGLQ